MHRLFMHMLCYIRYIIYYTTTYYFVLAEYSSQIRWRNYLALHPYDVAAIT